MQILFWIKNSNLKNTENKLTTKIWQLKKKIKKPKEKSGQDVKRGSE